MTVTPEQAAAAMTRLGRYNLEDYDPAENAEGFGNDGHSVNLEPMWSDMVVVGQYAGEQAEAAEAARSEVEQRQTAITTDNANTIATVTALKDAAAASLAGAQQAQTLAQNAAGGQAGVGVSLLSKSLVTAADVLAVHVYDTTQDSDGGAWRLKCAHTSWAQEAPSATRGARREFPPVALIVARQTSLTIYDALDLDASTGAPRVWMVFNCSGAWSAGNMLQTGPITSVFMLERRLCVTLSNNLHIIDFADDSCYVFNIYPTYGGRYLGGVAARNSARGYEFQGSSGSLPTLVGAPTSVHGRALPGAPLDHLGLPIPTVAVAGGSSGASVILPDGRVADITGATYVGCSILDDGRLILTRSDGGVDVGPIPYADVAVGSWRQRAYTSAAAPALLGSATGARATAGGFAARSPSGLTLVAEDRTTPANGMVACITKDYATGWLPGDVRLAALCDGTTGSNTGATVLSDGFASVSGWTASGGSIASVGAELEVTGSGSGTARAARSITTTPGVTYLLTISARRGSSAAGAMVDVNDTSGSYVALASATVSATSNQPVTIQFTALSAATNIYLQHGAANATGTVYFDDLLIRVAAPDRSYKSRGLVVNGTLSRAAVATGSDVVAYSGFSASNYLEQSYSADLDTATGDLAVIVWVNGAATVQRGYYTAGALSGARWRLVNTGAGILRFSAGDGSTENQAQLSQTIAAGTWRLAVGIIRRASSTIELWLDGVLVATASLTVGSLTNTNATLRAGTEHNGSVYGDGMALLRIGAYAPTPAKIRRMYRDERPLFDPGAKAFLGGTSNAVSSLARDASRGLLAVGTGDGVSVFSGLRRVSYLDGTALGSTIGNDAINAVGAGAGYTLIGTTANVGVYNAGVAYQDELAARPTPGGPALVWDGVTTDDYPTVIGRVHVSEGESLQVSIDVQAIDYVAAQTEGASYTLRARVRRAYGGLTVLVGNVFKITLDETSPALDATLAVNTGTNTIDIVVTGKAATRLRWRASGALNRMEAT